MSTTPTPSVFSLPPKPAEAATSTTAAPSIFAKPAEAATTTSAAPSIFAKPAEGTTPATGASLFPPKPAEAAAGSAAPAAPKPFSLFPPSGSTPAAAPTAAAGAAATTSTTPAPFSWGNFPKPAATTTTPAAGAPAGSLFPALNKPSAPEAASTPAAGTLFPALGKPPAALASTSGPTTAPATAAPPAFAGFSLPKQPAASTSAAPSAPGSTGAPEGGEKKNPFEAFGKLAVPAAPTPATGAEKPNDGAAAPSAPAGLPSLGLPTAPAAGGLGGFSLLGAGKKRDTSTLGSSTLGASALGVPATPATAATGTPATLGAVTAPAPAGAAPAKTTPSISHLQGHSMEDIVNRWSKDLESSVREYGELAREVAQWDRMLLENGALIGNLMSDVNDAERTQLLVDSALEHVETQQKELSTALDGYEALLSEMFEKNLGSSPYKTLTASGLDTGSGGVRDLRPADKTRQDAYNLAERLNRELDDMGRNLGQMIETINSLNTPSTGTSLSLSSSLNPGVIAASEDPVSQIVAILNSNLGTLQWIESKGRALEEKVRQTELMVAGTAAQQDGPGGVQPGLRDSTGARGTPRRLGRSRLGASANTSW